MATSTIEEARRPDEEQEHKYKVVNWKDFVTKPKYIPWWIGGIIVTALTILLTIHHDQIVDAMKPMSLKIRDIPAGFLIPVAILIAISFPPLFGHELIALLCGVVYGLWIGFAIVAAGTFLGEIGTWYAFKYAFRRKAVKLERTNLNYGAMTRATRDGGFLIVLIIRFSIIPSHFSTAVFSTCNVKFLYFAIATFLTLPKQIVLVYVGVLLVQESKNNTINTIVIGVSFISTTVAGAYIYIKMRKTKKVLLEEQKKRLGERKELERDFSPDMRLEVDLGRTQRWGGTVRGSGLPPPKKSTWKEGVYELDETRRPNVKPAEFIWF